jgi:phenylpropionate dioxygenase-like ring-hydroxylating dioxygenase large terminal subunit
MKAPRNTWYVAGWPSDFTAAPMQRTILEEPLVFFRTSAGKLAALHNICTHRFAPLHMGKVIDDTLECPAVQHLRSVCVQS